MLRNISAADPNRVRGHLPTDLGDMSVEIRDQPVICRRFVPTGSFAGSCPIGTNQHGRDPGRYPPPAMTTPRVRRPSPRGQTGTSPPDGQAGARRHGQTSGAKFSFREFPLRLGSPHSLHQAAAEAPLAGDDGSRALAHDPKIPVPVRFTLGMVMVAVHHPRGGVNDDPKT